MGKVPKAPHIFLCLFLQFVLVNIVIKENSTDFGAIVCLLNILNPMVTSILGRIHLLLSHKQELSQNSFFWASLVSSLDLDTSSASFCRAAARIAELMDYLYSLAWEKNEVNSLDKEGRVHIQGSHGGLPMLVQHGSSSWLSTPECQSCLNF